MVETSGAANMKPMSAAKLETKVADPAAKHYLLKNFEHIKDLMEENELLDDHLIRFLNVQSQPDVGQYITIATKFTDLDGDEINVYHLLDKKEYSDFGHVFDELSVYADMNHQQQENYIASILHRFNLQVDDNEIVVADSGHNALARLLQGIMMIEQKIVDVKD